MQQKQNERGDIIGVEFVGPVTIDMIGESDCLVTGDGCQLQIGPKRLKAGRPFSIAIKSVAEPPKETDCPCQEPS